jgi:hypothetical protein
MGGREVDYAAMDRGFGRRARRTEETPELPPNPAAGRPVAGQDL